MKQSLQFLGGFQSFDMVTDHRPALDKLDNPRRLRLRLQMARYNFTPRWIPENHNIEADALSRSAISQGAPSNELGEGPQNFTARIAMIAIIAESATTNIDINTKRSTLNKRSRRCSASTGVHKKCTNAPYWSHMDIDIDNAVSSCEECVS
jgi:hypothetical protein